MHSGRSAERRAPLAVAGLAISGALGWSSPATAQSVPPGAALAAESDIVVTARDRTETRQEVPISVQTFGPLQLERLGVRDLRDLSAFEPGLMVESQYPTTPSIVVRGISSDTADVTAEPRVSVFQD